MRRGRSWGRSIVPLLVGLAAAVHLNAAEKSPAVEVLINDAAAVPAEFAADLFIRIASSPNLHDRTRKRELLENAFMRAYGAQESFKRAAPAAPIDTQAGGIARAYATGLDTLTLQLRAIAGLASVDAALARELFDGVSFYQPPATCDSPLVPVADEYYGTLATIARRTFENTAEGHAAALRFFEIYLWRAHLPSEVSAVVRAVKAMRLSRVEAGYFEDTLNAIVDHFDTDARGFSTYGLDIVPKMTELADADRVIGVLGESLMRAERKLLVAQLKARCSDSAAETPIAESFNTIVRRRDIALDLVAPLANADVRPVKVLGAAPPQWYWQTEGARRLVFALLALRDSAAGPRSVLIKRSDEWQAAALQYLTDLELWNGAGEPIERDYFDQKSLLYDVYLNLLLKGDLRTRVVQSFADFIARSDTGRLPRALWFSNVKRLLEHGDVATSAMEQSGHYLLTLYARAERLLGNNRREH
ncbi:MAG: hypothetical protein ABJA98_06330 [Acidobacteriota bacterium]